MPEGLDILHLCPLWFPIAKDAQGGIETLLYQLVEALEAKGCRNTLIATADSLTSGSLVPAVDSGLFDKMRSGQAWEYGYYEQQVLRLALEQATETSIFHSHIGYPAYVLSSVPSLHGRVLHTVHSPVGEDMQWYVRQHPDIWMSTVSEFQAGKLRAHGATRVRAIHNAINVSAFTFRQESDGGLLYIGRMEAVKGPDLAVRVAREMGLPLTLAGPMTDPGYFEKSIRPSLGGTIQYAGVVGHAQKNDLYGRAGCVVLPFRGEEPFGLVAIEAMACGTPVVTLANGALPEIVEPGLTGFLVDEGDALAEATLGALALDREAVRCRVAERFDIPVAARRYLDLYREIRESA